MPTAQITDIQPAGQKFYSQAAKADLYPFFVTFSDGVAGTANAKNYPPNYRIGDTMDYAITGDHRGTPKLKISKPGSDFAPPPRAAAPNPVRPVVPVMRSAPEGQRPAKPYFPAESTPVNGQTVGMAVKEALALVTKDCTHETIVADVCREDFWQGVAEVASDIIRVSRHLEAGNLYPSVRDRNTPAEAPRAQPRSQNRGASDAQLANVTGGPDEDVPF